MASNRYFLWDGCDVPEMVARLNLADFRKIENPTVGDLISETDVLQADLVEKNKGDLLSTLRSKLTEPRYNEFITELFESVGKKGNTLNIQFNLGTGFDYEELISSLQENVNDGDPSEVTSPLTEDRLFDYESNDNGSTVDLLFKIKEIDTLDLSTNFDFTEYRDLDRDTLTDEWYRDVECRVYIERNVLAISKRGLDKEQISRIRRVVSQWADGTTTPGLTLSENELLCIQNQMDGENSGLDFGEFREKNIRSAKYRGDRAEALARSRVVSPAQETGEITQLRYYYTYTGTSAPMDVQVRIHRDGHITTTQPTEPDFVDTFIDVLLTVKNNNMYLTRTEKVLDDFIDDVFRREILKKSGSKNYKSRKIQSLKDVARSYTNPDEYEAVEVQAFHSVILNISRELIKADIENGLDSGQYPIVSHGSENPPNQSEIRGLFDNIAEFDLEEPDYDYDRVWDHIYSILSDNHQSPLSIVQTAVDEYNI